MDDDRDMLPVSRKHNRDGYEAALGKYNIRLNCSDKLPCFKTALDNTERVGKIFLVEITSELTG